MESCARRRALLSERLANPAASQDSAPALLFQGWYPELAEALFRPQLGDPLYRRLLAESYMVNAALDILLLTDRHSDWWPAPKATVSATRRTVTLQRLETALGPMQSWRAGELLPISAQSPLDSTRFHLVPVPGQNF